jgi:hypothetical protein
MTFGVTAILGSAAPARARDCALSVTVEGDEPARTQLADALARVGAGHEPTPGCAQEVVQVAAREGAFALTITDPYGRVTHRLVTDLETAAAIVESTPGADALLPLLPEGDTADAVPLEDQPIDARPLQLVEPPAPPAVVAQSPAPDRTPERGLSLSVATELVTGFDGSSWAGIAVSGCVLLGATCVGTSVRFWNDLEADEESGNAIHRRTAGQISLLLDMPLSRGRLTLRPGIELGLGWVHMGSFSVSPGASGGDNDSDQGEVVPGAHIAASYALARRWAIEGGVGASLSLFAHHSPFTVEGTRLPGEPVAFGILSLGVRYGGP